MTSSVHWVDHEKGVIRTFAGVLTEADIQSSIMESVGHPDRFSGYSFVIYDMTRVETISISRRTIIANAEQAIALSELRVGC